jgi:putative addiction module killer protein
LTKAVRARIQLRVQRFELGNLGDYKNVGQGVWEACVMSVLANRIYFGKDGDSIVVLLVGGDKGSQAKDIARARGFWRDYLEAKKHGKAT